MSERVVTAAGPLFLWPSSVLSAGGGFSGGAILGASLILYVRAYGAEKLEKIFTFNTYK
ncbi:MAG: MnhB domain-containing protein, partial [Stenotrophomonas maltophilia]